MSRGKGRRLSRSSEFQRVYRQGRSKANRYLVLYSFARGEAADEASRFGVSVGRKVGNAVVRNRVKRTIREALDELEPKLADLGLIKRRCRGCRGGRSAARLAITSGEHSRSGEGVAR